MSLGAVNAGISVALAVELDPHAAATYRRNFPSVRLIEDDISALTEIDIDCHGQQTVLFGGPPCQGFSTSNQRTRNTLNEKNWLFQEFLRVAKLWMPDWIVFENVKGITETEGGIFLDAVLEEIAKFGFTPVSATLNAVDFGVPQKRSRLFVVASRDGVKFEMPAPRRAKYLTVADAFCQLPELYNGARRDFLPYEEENASKYAKSMRGHLQQCSGHLVTQNASYVVERYKHIKQGGNWEDIPEHLMTNYADRTRCHTGIYHRLKLDEPSIVIGNYRKNMLIHPCQNRGLSVREAARLQSFPDTFDFEGSIGFRQQQVGNAVPPLLAQAVFEVLKINEQIRH